MPEYPRDAPVPALCCDRHPRNNEALAFAWADGQVERRTFGDVADASRALARALAAAGVGTGQPVAVVLPQCPLAPVAHLALARLDAIAVPLSPLFGPDGLAPRLAQSNAVLALAHAGRADAVREAAPGLPLWAAEGRFDELPPADLRAREASPPSWARGHGAEAPLCVIFTSGTTAQPKGAVLPRRVIAGRMGGVALAHPGFPAPGDRFWSPADWAWIGGLHDVLLAPWAAGVPVAAYERRGPFDAARAAAFVEQLGVRNAFLPPTALRLWMRSGAPAPGLRTLHTAGEPLPEPVHAWAAKAFAAAPREVYGLTECAFLLVNDEATPGVTGRAVPDVELALRGDGELAVRADAPTMMLGYLAGDALHLPLDGGWLRTGDLAVEAKEGWRVLGRVDDVVKIGGYRVAPREVEAALLRHAAVDEAAVVGVSDEVRGAALRAFVKLAPGAAATDALARELQAWVRDRLASHEVPRSVAFVAELPRTATGKVRRRDLRGPPESPE
ncbi:MAG TPA: AMP-binding protein [Candidatus Thermoplasmatota archaeon]|jgi:acetyl-CoA synthetase|nr:AMP-binding protein [Candidatus Thermoplasmatota archaeon]